jgi:hypothetical protein
LIWDAFFTRYKIPFVRIGKVDELEQIPSNGVLLLPSAVALSDREIGAIASARERGISILSTWLTGVRDEAGEWRGFEFMEKVLGAQVVGNTEDSEDDSFMILHGDNPIAHSIEAGSRVGMERTKDFLPLRLIGKNSAAQIMDWSRTYSRAKKSGLIVFDEKRQAGGVYARNVVFGYSEQAWISASPMEMDAVAHNAISWLFRQPDAYLAAWPFPFKSAMVMAVQGGEELMEIDYEFAKDVESVGGHATYYLLPETVTNSSGLTKRIQKRGHEIAYSGDKFTGFKGQSAQTQSQRLKAMRKGFDDVGIKIPGGGGFYAPLDSYDKVTEGLLIEGGFDHFLASADITESRLPFIAKGSGGESSPLVILPRTQAGPEDLMERGDPVEGLQTFLEELDLTTSMGALSVVRLPAQTILTEGQLDLFFGHLKSRSGEVWMPSAGEVAQWWRGRSNITVRLEPHERAPVLVVTVSGQSAAPANAAVWVNLPRSNAPLRLEAADLDDPLPPVAKLDAWRSAIAVGGLMPGEYCWYLYFDTPKNNSYKR